MSDTALAQLFTGSYDETLMPDGSQSPDWSDILAWSSQISPEQIARHQQEISLRLRSNGIAFGTAGHASANQRPWNLDLIPYVISNADWQLLELGLTQRARLKQAMLDDIYGEQTLLSERVIPPQLLFAHGGFLRSSRYDPNLNRLPLYCADVSRSPDGRWYVVDDLCQSAMGIGFALENRMVLSGVLPQFYRSRNINRIAHYYRALTELLADALLPDSRCVLLGYGASHPYYFELAYLAKYLGYTLVELGDLIVREEHVWLKTVAGLRRIDVILRFVDDRDMDPLVTDSSFGVPGLLDVARNGHVEIINPVGTAVLENPGFNAYQRELCLHYLDEEPLVPSAPTYWLGDKSHLDVVQSRFDELLYRHIDSVGQLLDPALMSGQERTDMLKSIDLSPQFYIAQERIERSIAPSLTGTQHTTHHVTLRSFFVGAQRNFVPMEGGLCLLDSVPHGRRPRIGALEGSKDVWVSSDSPTRFDSLLQSGAEAKPFVILEGELPSRVADNLYWLGRYSERAENTVRILRLICRQLQYADELPDQGRTGGGLSDALSALFFAVTAATGTQPGFRGKGGKRRRQQPNHELISLLTDAQRAGTLGHSMQQLQTSADSLRDRLSPEVLRILRTMQDQQQQLQQILVNRKLYGESFVLMATEEQLNLLLTSLSAFAGIIHENMTHSDGWRFLILGRRIDRARQGAAVLSAVLQVDRSANELLEILLRFFDSLMTYRSRYRSQIDATLVLELLVMDESNPRSLAYQFHCIDSLIRDIPGMRRSAHSSALLKIAAKGISRVRLADAAELLEAGSGSRQSLSRFLQIVQQVPDETSAALTAAYFAHSEVLQYLDAMSPAEQPAS